MRVCARVCACVCVCARVCICDSGESTLLRIFVNPLITYTLYTRQIMILSCGTLFFSSKCASDMALRGSSNTHIK